jgi:catechol 2,3-dioxygenase-like lactoylglutathione lyase family enzyme
MRNNVRAETNEDSQEICSMKRFHVHVAVSDLKQSTDFYSTLFGVAPSVLKDDYAKWMLDDPRINFAISKRTENLGVNHLGLQVDSDSELRGMRDQLAHADKKIVAETGANCCYAKSDKYWVTDPQGIAWETFHSLGTIPVYGDGTGEAPSETRACCTPEPVTPSKQSACCAGSC